MGLTMKEWITFAILTTQGGGGTLTFSSYVGLDSHLLFTKIKSGISGIPPKIFEILATPKNIPILYIYIDRKKRP